MKITKKIYYLIEFIFLKFVVIFLNLISYSMSMRLAEFIGSFMYCAKKRRREISIKNIKLVFGDTKSEVEIHKIGRTSMQGLVKTAFEFIRIPKIAKHADHYINMEGEHYVWEALDAKRGLIFVISHFGSWELMGISAGFKGFPLYGVGKPVKNPFIYKHIKKLRAETGMGNINKKGAVRASVKCLKQNKIIAVLIDQHAKEAGVWVDFFGHKAKTSSFPATLALRLNAPVIPCFLPRSKKLPSTLSVHEPFSLIRTGDFEADVLANTQQYIRCLEREILKNPGEWLWMHNRWRSNLGD